MKPLDPMKYILLLGGSGLLALAPTTAPAAELVETQPHVVDPDPVVLDDKELLSSEYGDDVQSSGDVIVIGASRLEVNYIYERNDDDAFVATTSIPGHRCVLDEQHLLCGGEGDARIYVRSSFGTWDLLFDAAEDLSMFSPPPAGPLLAFEDDLFVSATDEVARIYARQANGSWDFQWQLSLASLAEDGISAEFFQSIAISNDRILIGDPLNSDEANYAGAIYTFQRGAYTGQLNMYEWDHQQTLRHPVPVEVGSFGRDVQAVGELLVTKSKCENTCFIETLMTGRFDGDQWILDPEITWDSIGLEPRGGSVVFDTDGERIIFRKRFNDTDINDPDAFLNCILQQEPGGWSIEHTLRIDCEDNCRIDQVAMADATAILTSVTRIIDNTDVVHGTGRVFDLEQQPCTVDLDGNGLVNVNDLLAIIGNWGGLDPAYDPDGDGSTGVGDLLLVLTFWGECD